MNTWMAYSPFILQESLYQQDMNDGLRWVIGFR